MIKNYLICFVVSPFIFIFLSCESKTKEKPMEKPKKFPVFMKMITVSGLNNFKATFIVEDPHDQQKTYEFRLKIEKSEKYNVRVDTTWNNQFLDSGMTVALRIFHDYPYEESQNATYTYKNNSFQLVREIQGTEIDTLLLRNKLNQLIKSGGAEMHLLSENLYVKPEINYDSQKLVTAKNALERCLSTHVTLSHGGLSFNLERNIFGPWLGLDEDLKVQVDHYSAQLYVQKIAGQIEKPYSQLLDELMATQPIDSTTQASFPRINIAHEVDEIVKCISNGVSRTREIVFISRGLPHGIKKGLKEFVEISIVEQKLWLFKNGQLILETDVVTGNERLKRTTPTGDFKVLFKQRNRTLRGRGYAAFVSYWMPFFQGYGMHDANWRSRFGASIYQTRGSHGCVNMPPKIASIVYQNVEVGMPVIIR